LGIAYTNDPSAEEVADSGEDVVRNSSKFGPLFVSWRWMFVCGALGNGKETSIGTWDASPLANVVAIAWADIEVVKRPEEAARGSLATLHSGQYRTSPYSITHP
jgi:hypothetical protein